MRGGYPAEDAARAAQMKAAGDAAMDKLRFADAVDAYQQAFTLAHEPAVLYNLGRALEGLGSYPRGPPPSSRPSTRSRRPI